MEKKSQHANSQNAPKKENNHQNNHNKNKSRRHHRRDHHKKDQPVPNWSIENTARAIELKDTKADLMELLEAVNPEELMMTSLVQQSKALKALALRKQTAPTEGEEIANDPALEIDSSKVKIDLGQTCPICEKPIREIMYALHDYDHDSLAHFDCVFKKVHASVKEKLTNKRYLAYLGSGSFGIMEPAGDKKPMALIEKIYPGAPLEELLHVDEQEKDEQL